MCGMGCFLTKKAHGQKQYRKFSNRGATPYTQCGSYVAAEAYYLNVPSLMIAPPKVFPKRLAPLLGNLRYLQNVQELCGMVAFAVLTPFREKLCGVTQHCVEWGVNPR